MIASGAAASAAGYLFRSPGVSPAHAQTAGTVERLVTLNVNGASRRVDVLPQETLSQTIRYKLGLTGTKLGCDRGECGACTMIIDGITVYSCTTLTHSVRGRKITTIEGIEGPDGKLHQVQAAFVEELGPQCGFCTQRPGDGGCRAAEAQSAPDASKRRAWRCPAISVGAAPTITTSKASCARRRRRDMANKLIGKNFPPHDVVAKVTGRRNTPRISAPKAWSSAKLLTSPMPHASVRNIDASDALKMPGVVGILTADDVPQFPPPQRPILRRTRCSSSATQFWRSPPWTKLPRRTHWRRSRSTSSNCRTLSIRSTACSPAGRMRGPTATWQQRRSICRP